MFKKTGFQHAANLEEAPDMGWRAPLMTCMIVVFHPSKIRSARSPALALSVESLQGGPSGACAHLSLLRGAELHL